MATAATDRSMPPVSMTSVWPPARMPSGAANSSALEIQVGVTVPGRDHLDAGDEHEQQQDQHDESVCRRRSGSTPELRSRGRSAPALQHGEEAADHDHAARSALPWMTWP